VRLEAHGLERAFGHGRSRRPALRGVDLVAEPGELVAVHGRSGAGKTTLLNLLAGFDRPDAGRVEIDGKPLMSLGDRGTAELRRGRLGFVFQTFGLLPVLTAAENVEVPLRLVHATGDERDRRVREALDLVGLGPRARHFPDQLSGGEQQRTAIARALVSDPPLLLADEPTSQLDSVNARRVAELLRRRAHEGATVVVATHDPIVVEAADRAIALEDGLVVSQPSASAAARGT
jgi:putative ABC transport system ATP-binding protein